MADAGASATGTLTGTTITLDTPVPALEGQRVSVVLEPVFDERVLSPTETHDLWREWVAHGEQGPLDEESDPEFP